MVSQTSKHIDHGGTEDTEKRGKSSLPMGDGVEQLPGPAMHMWTRAPSPGFLKAASTLRALLRELRASVVRLTPPPQPCFRPASRSPPPAMRLC
jgi:hypothetical protein